MADSIYIKMPNDIKGESSMSDHVDEIAVSSISWGVSRPTSVNTSGRQTGVANVSEVAISKSFDSASNDLALACLKATAMDEIVISFRKDAGDASIDYIVITLKGALISSYSFSGSYGGDTPMDSFTISFTEIKCVYKKAATDHSEASEHEMEYNIRAAS